MIYARSLVPHSLVALTLVALGPAASQAQDAPPASSDADRVRTELRTEMDLLRDLLERLSEEQMAAIERVNESRRTELDALREALYEQSARMRDAQRDLTQAQRQQSQQAQTQRQQSQTQRQQIEEVRARLLEEYRRFGDTLRAQGLDGLGGLWVGPDWLGFGTGTVPFGSPGNPPPPPDIPFAYVPGSGDRPSLVWGAGWPQSLSLTPLLIGQRAVAGAELVDVNATLGSYFDVAEGVLIVSVADGSPADEADLRPGDVIMAVDDEPVTTIDEVREVMARAVWAPSIPLFDRQGVRPEPGEPIRLRIVREGTPTEAVLPR